MDGDKFRRFVLYAVIALCVLCGPFLYGYYLGLDTARLPSLDLGFSPKHEHHLSSATGRTKDFHLLIPATSTDNNLCKLMLTGAILGYPEPIILGWEHKGVFDGAKSHLFKITETASYLRELPPSADEDLVFIVDAFDIWFQLRPSVMISRYYQVLKEHDDVLRDQGILGLGRTETGAPIRSRLLFGADKWPGPPFFDEPYVWAVPNSTWPDDVFGPETQKSDIDHRRPQFLNSGTMFGTVRDMLDFFEATEDAIMKVAAEGEEKLEVSDQHFFGKVWGPQEMYRQIVRDGKEAFEKHVPDGARHPNMDGMRTEYGVTLDNEHKLFQLASGWYDWLVTLKFNGKETPKFPGEVGSAYKDKNYTLQEDVLRSEGPYAALEEGEIPGQNASTGWDEIVLGANVINRQPYALLHHTGDKSTRERWWPALWFHPHGEILQKATRRRQIATEEPEVFLEMDGIRYKQPRKLFLDHEKAGAWRRTGEYLSWKQLCSKTEARKEFYNKDPK